MTEAIPRIGDEIVGVAIDSETSDAVVIYRNTERMFTRPMGEFFGTVQVQPNEPRVWRFAFLCRAPA